MSNKTVVQCRAGRFAVRLAALMMVASALEAGAARPAPSKELAVRLSEGPEVFGLVHWGLNTYTGREWGFGDADPALLAPAKFNADQIVGACRSGGLGGLVIVAKHHDGFCLWPTKTTDYNISKSPFRRGKGDYVREMSDACRKAGLKFGVYVSPWDRNNAHYGSARYADIFRDQIKELLCGSYGKVFEMWFDGANGGDGWYGGARERRKVGAARDYYRYDEIFPMVRRMQPGVTIFAGEMDSSDFRWPGNERGILGPDSRATITSVGVYEDGRYSNPAYRPQMNSGSPDGQFFRVCEADFPLRRGWFWHANQAGTVKSAAYLMKLYLSSVGNGGTMNIGVAPNRDGLLDDADVRALKGFGVLRKAFFSKEVKPGGLFNVVVMKEDISKGEQVDGWEFKVGGRAVLAGTAIGVKRIRVLDKPVAAVDCSLDVTRHGGDLQGVSYKLYYADPELVKTVNAATTDSGETDTARWMTRGYEDK